MHPAPAAELRRRSLIRTIVSLLSARGMGLALRILASLIVARIAGPDAVGIVAWLGIFSMYVLWFTGGVVNGAERLVPIRSAQHAESEVTEIWRVTTMVSLLAAALCTALGLCAWAYFLREGTPLQAWKFLGAGLLAGLSLFGNHVSAVFTANNRLEFVSRRFFLEGVLWWVLLPLAWAGAVGLTVRTLLVALLPSLYCLLSGKAFYQPAWNRPLAAMLAREGLPILLSGFLLLLSFGMDRTLIALFMSDTALGHYVLATSVISVMRMVQYAMNRVLIPNLGELYGKTGNPHEVARTALCALPPLLAFLAPCVTAGWFLMEPITRWLLPAYLPGVPAAKIALLGGACISLLGTNAFFVTIGRQKTLIGMLLAGLAVQAAVSIVLFRQYGTLESFAWGFAAGALTNALLVNGGILPYSFPILRPKATR